MMMLVEDGFECTTEDERRQTDDDDDNRWIIWSSFKPFDPRPSLGTTSLPCLRAASEQDGRTTKVEVEVPIRSSHHPRPCPEKCINSVIERRKERKLGGSREGGRWEGRGGERLGRGPPFPRHARSLPSRTRCRGDTVSLPLTHSLTQKARAASCKLKRETAQQLGSRTLGRLHGPSTDAPARVLDWAHLLSDHPSFTGHVTARLVHGCMTSSLRCTSSGPGGRPRTNTLRERLQEDLGTGSLLNTSATADSSASREMSSAAIQAAKKALRGKLKASLKQLDDASLAAQGELGRTATGKTRGEGGLIQV